LVNPNWQHRFYTDEDCTAWIAKHCPHLASVYHSYTTGIHRADFFRIAVLYYEGGVYADIDVECLRPLDELLSRLEPGKTVYLVRDHPVHERIHFAGRAMWMNDFIIAAPGDPLIGEVLNWLVNSPSTSTASADAVMETGPCVMSAVIEMLGGPEMIPNLGIIPTPWVHPLPDMNCDFHEKAYYRRAIATREWLRREAFVVHYWFHTWVKASETNMLTDDADVLLSTRGEQVERLFQWELRDSTSDADFVMAAALAEFAEQGREVEFWLGAEQNDMVNRFLELLALSGLQPGLRYRCWGTSDKKANPLRWRLEGMGAVEVTEPARKPVLLVLSGFIVTPPIREVDGLLLGPSIERGEVIASGGGLTLTELWTDRHAVPPLLHLFPSDEPFAEAISIHFAERGWATRRWTLDQLRKLLQDETQGSLNPEMITSRSLEVAAALIILREQGGAVFNGDSKAAAEALAPLHRPTLLTEPHFWLFACEPRCPLLEGAFEHWLGVRKRSRANVPAVSPSKREAIEHLGTDASLREFIDLRLRAMQRAGQATRLHVRRTTAAAVP